MSLKKRLRQTAKKIVFGGNPLPNRVFLAQTEPQQEVTVWLLGAGDPIDVTRRHCQACGAPFVLCVGFKRGATPSQAQLSNLTLRFSENGGSHRILGEIGLQWLQTVDSGDSEFLLFRATSAVNYLLPTFRLWMYGIRNTYAAWRTRNLVRTTILERRAMAVLFICPRPVSLICVSDGDGSNIYPLNVMGDLGENFFALCLKTGWLPQKCVERTRRLVLSSVPMVNAPIAYSLGPNHRVPTIDLHKLPFATRPSQTFGIHVPNFACRVREMEIDHVLNLGFHTFFLARVISDEHIAEVPELCVAHGFYQNWRIQNLGISKPRADAEDAHASNKLSPGQSQLLSYPTPRI